MSVKAEIKSEMPSVLLVSVDALKPELQYNGICRFADRSESVTYQCLRSGGCSLWQRAAGNG